MYDRFRRKLPYPIPSLGTVVTYLKLFPPESPVYVRLVGSRRNAYTDADLFKLVHVSPEEIQYRSPRFAGKWELAGRVVDGEWDRDPARYDESSFVDGVDASFHRSLERHFVDDVRWEETPFVREVLDCVAEGKTTWTCTDRHDVEEKCTRIDRLYERIANDGYMTQEQRRRADIRDLKQSRRSRIFRWLKEYTVVGKDEITVNVARDGTLLFFSGKHRMSIAKILGLDSIPVLVLARHEAWQAIRDAANEERGLSAVLPANRLDHPDLRDIEEQVETPTDS